MSNGYKLDENLIYDEKAMWQLACTFKTRYNSIVEKIEEIENDEVVYIKGKSYYKEDKEYKKTLNQLKNDLKCLDDILKTSMKLREDISKYVIKE